MLQVLTSAGHPADVPVQFSGGSQLEFVDGRHTVVAASSVSVGQLLLMPSQLSPTSHAPAEGRHTAVLLVSDGHVPLDPVQASAVSQTPAEGRQTWPAVRYWQDEVQHDAAVPLAAPRSHCSPDSIVPFPQTLEAKLTVNGTNADVG